MTPAELQAIILADADCAPHVVDNDAPKQDARAKDQAIADILNAKGAGASSRAVPCHLAKKLLIKRGRWRAIVLASANAGHQAVDAAYAAVALAEDARMDADFLDPAAVPLLDALVATNLLSVADRQAIEALSRAPSAITAADVSRALRGPWEE